eukprot:TRINITY_DN2547_c1_g1_i1.p1 TRINITY_DN2547_c1_g1~~TRINITY_DN2547_c1_g1_i1.p1  ORF type:complete len:553 (+),score=112.82 TRINITY_DN2547_c1_g1_i1:304-1962(+)
MERRVNVLPAMNLSWTVGSDRIYFELEVAHSYAWAAIGFNPVGADQMQNADINCGTASEGQFIVRDYWSFEQNTPSLDVDLGGSNDVNFLFGEVVNGHTIYQWWRYLLTPDALYDKPLSASRVRVIAAHGIDNEPDVEYHFSRRVGVEVDFGSKGCPDPTCSGRGKCDELLGLCVCDPRYEGDDCSIELQEYDFLTPLAPGLFMAWKIVDQEISIQLAFDRLDAWVAIGFEPTQGMENVDIIACEYDGDGVPVVSDRWSVTYERPALDTERGGWNNLIEARGFQSDVSRVFQFKRLLVTNDTRFDRPIGEVGTLIWAHGVEGQRQMTQHSVNNRGTVTINWQTGVVTQKDEWNFRYLHAMLMVVSYPVCMTFGVFIARYLKSVVWWFKVHILLQSFAVATAVAGFGLAFDVVAEHFDSTHAKMGYFVVGGTVLQVAIGWLADYLYDENRKTIPFWPDKTHWWIGRLTILASWATVILGIRELDLGDEVLVGFCILLGIYTVVFVYMEAFWNRNAYRRDPADTVPLLREAQIQSYEAPTRIRPYIGDRYVASQ